MPYCITQAAPKVAAPFDAQDIEYQLSVIPDDVPAVSVEAGVSFGWSSYADAHVAIDRFGLSAPGDTAMEVLGMTADNVANVARDLLS